MIYYIKDKYKSIRHWYKTCGKYKEHWQFVWFSMFNCFPWDSSYKLKTEYYWLKKSLRYFSEQSYCAKDKNDQIIRYQKICIGLLETILDIRDFWYFDVLNKVTVLTVPVNTKNHHRFPYIVNDYTENRKYESIELYKHSEDEYYKLKAKHLYYKIIREFQDEWWD